MTILQEAQKRATPAKLSLRIGLMSNAGFGNLGNIASDRAMIENIRLRWPDGVIHSFSPYPEGAGQELNIPSFPTTSSLGNGWWEGSEENTLAAHLNHIVERLRTSPSRLLRKLFINAIGSILELLAWIRAYRHLKKFDILVVSGGGQLDDYCWGGRWGYPFALLLWGVLAKLSDVKYYIVSVGAGPLDSSFSRLLVRGALSLAQYRSYRDRGSKQYVSEIVGFPADDPIYPDLAHSLKLEKYQEAAVTHRTQHRTNYRAVVGINPYIGSVMTGEITKLAPPYPCMNEGELYVDYVRKLAGFVSWLVQNQYQVRFIASETYELWHDYHQVSKDIRNILDSNGVVYGEDQIVDGSTHTLDDLMVEISLTDLVVASRFHSVLLSQLMDKPVLALSFTSKIDQLMTDTGHSEYCLQIDRFDVDTLKDRFTALEANRDSIKRQLAQRTEEYREALDEQYDRLFGRFPS